MEFCPFDVKVPDHIVIENVHLSESLYTLAYLLNEENIETNC